MAVQTNRPSNRIFVVIGIILAVAAAVGAFLISKGGGGSGTSVQVVVATTVIPAGTPVTANELTTANADQGVVPQAPAFYQNINDVVGQQFVNEVEPNTIITKSLVVNSASVLQQTADTLPVITPGFVAMAIPATPAAQPFSNGGFYQTAGVTGDQVSAGYYIAAGDHIDILVDDGTGVHYAFQDVRVLKAGAPTAGLGAAVTFYIVELPRNQAEAMTFILTHSLIPSATDATQPKTLGRNYDEIVKYVLRPVKEYGDTSGAVPPNKNKPTYPNYQDSCPAAPKPLPYTGFTCANLPATNDPKVTDATLNSLFNSGH